MHASLICNKNGRKLVKKPQCHKRKTQSKKDHEYPLIADNTSGLFIGTTVKQCDTLWRTVKNHVNMFRVN